MNLSVSHSVTMRPLPLLVETSSPEQFALYPSEAGGGVKITQDEMLELSRIYSRFYEVYIYRLSARLTSQFNISDSAASLLARRALVPLIHCFMDRLIRVKKAIECAPGQLATPRQKLFPATNTIEAFEECAVASPVFNQSIIWYIGRVWQLPESAPVPESQSFIPQTGFKNNLFRLYTRSPWILMKKIGLRLLARLPRSRFPALTMANATGAFFQHGFYSKYLHEVKLHWSPDETIADKELRESLFTNEFIENIELNEFLANIGLGEEEIDRTKNLFKDFLQFYYPTSLLEAAPQNMQQALQALQFFKKPALISSSGRSTRDSYIVAAAKQKGLSIVDHQHGGHYGYIEDVRVVLDLEYPGVDRFVSWGWSRLPDHIAVKGLSVIDLPSPWLSERKRYWAGLSLGGKRGYDFLLMPNMVKRFPAAPHGASTSRIDLVQEMAASLKNLVGKVTGGGLSILHKPYNTTTVTLLAKTMEELEKIGGGKYLCEQQLDKGLTPELLRRCHVVLWDQPGTGFLECLSSNIPTMVYWPRTYSQEETWIQSVFSEFEQLGIVHRNTETLIAEMHRFKDSPYSWMNDPARVALVNRFCREFAWTSDEWPQYWRRYFDGLAANHDIANK